MSEETSQVMKKKQIKKLLKADWGKGYEFKVLEILNREDWGVLIVFYRVTCDRDESTEHRCKNLIGNSKWDYVTKIQF